MCLNWTHFVGEFLEGGFLANDSFVRSYLSLALEDNETRWKRPKLFSLNWQSETRETRDGRVDVRHRTWVIVGVVTGEFDSSIARRSIWPIPSHMILSHEHKQWRISFTNYTEILGCILTHSPSDISSPSPNTKPQKCPLYNMNCWLLVSMQNVKRISESGKETNCYDLVGMGLPRAESR